MHNKDGADRNIKLLQNIEPSSRRTLFVCHEPPFPPISGTDLRVHGNAVAATAFGPVCVASIKPLTSETLPVDRNIRVVPLTIPGEKRGPVLGWRRANGESKIPRSALARLKALIQDFRPDTIIVEGTPLLKLLGHLRPLAKQLILDMHNVESDLIRQSPQGRWRRPFAPNLRTLERKAAGIADRIWVCSELDRKRLKAIVTHSIPIDVVPNGIPRAEERPHALPPMPDAANGFPTILFVGHLSYPPNVDAAERLARIILARIRQALPTAKLMLAGRSPHAAVQALSALDGVTLVENPQDVRPLLATAHLAIIPLTTGGGTRIKILEAMFSGVPVVATPLAAEGLDLVDGDDALFSSTEQGLANLAVGLCSDLDRMANLRIRALDTAWRRFGPQAIRESVRHGLGLESAGP
ncbi:glycosyltransferase [Mesorhizobium sp. RCC_202]|uniref:glycosyltransferase n=1 Tax=Mesorhizobium sp. RCC_202 TaxID=3239222 RepID=UPI003526222C